jgi:hypothetical protein
MRLRVAIFFLLCLSVYRAAVFAQQPPNQLPKSILRTLFQSLGWVQPVGSAPLSVLATGALTYYDPDGAASSTVGVTIKCSGSSQYRIDVSEAGGTQSTIVNGLSAVHIAADGKIQKLPASTAVSMQSPMFPFLDDALNPDNPDSLVEDSGLQDAPVGIAQRLHVTIPASTEFKAGLKSRAYEKTVWFSSDGTPARIDFFRVGADNHYARVPFSLLLSDYRQVAGIAVAFRQEEQLDGKTITVLTLQSVRIGASSGVSPSDFQSPVVAGGTR